MNSTYRHYDPSTDYPRVDEFLIRNHQPGNMDGNWLEPIWEYMHGHPFLDASALGKIGIWEADGDIVAVAHYESRLCEAFFDSTPISAFYAQQMLEYAEGNLFGVSHEKTEENSCPPTSTTTIPSSPNWSALAAIRKLKMTPGRFTALEIPDPFPPIHLPDGFRLTSLAEECDWTKVHRVMWRGFNHPGEPPMSDVTWKHGVRCSIPAARRDLKIAVAAPNGDFVAFCGMFYEPVGKLAYVEPVATDPIYRRLGLGKSRP